jgi:hypothetical protein
VTASVTASADGAGAVTGTGAAIAASIFTASGSGTVEAVGEEAPSDSGAADISGTGTASAVGASIVAADFSAQGFGDVLAASPEPDPVPVVTYPPVGGGGGFGPAPHLDDKRFRTRKDKSRPKVITVRIGDWPENPQIILGREQDAERESFYRQLSQRKEPEILSAVDEEEQILLAILAMAA